MKCARIRKIILRSDETELTETVLHHAHQCPRCGRVLEQTTTVRRLMHLKTYEQPAADAQGRCLAELRDRIAVYQSVQDQPEQVGVSAPGFGWRFGLAAAFVALIGFNVLSTPRLPTLQSFIPEADLVPYRSYADSQTAPLASPWFDSLYASNRLDNLYRVSEPATYFTSHRE